MTDPAPARPTRRRRALPRVALVALVVLGLLTAAAAALYLNRRAAAREALVGWLDRKGIEAEVEVERVELDGFVGRIRIGDPSDPDFVVERAEVDYAIGWPWSGGFGLTPSRIRLVRPVLRASWRDGVLSLGSLDPLVEEFTSRPPRPDRGAPLVIVERGQVRLNTEYGPVRILADGRVEDGKLTWLKASMPAAALKSGEVAARGVSARLEAARVEGDRLTFRLDVGAESFALPGLSGQGGALRLEGRAPYPDLRSRRGDGAAALTLDAAADALTLGGTRLDRADLDLRLEGEVGGWIDDARFAGRGAGRLGWGRLDGAGLEAAAGTVRIADGRVALAREPRGLAWRIDQAATTLTASAFRAATLGGREVAVRSAGLAVGGRGAAFEASGPVRLTAGRLSAGDLALDRVRGDLSLDLVRDGPLTLEAQGALTAADGAWPLFGPAAADDVPELAEMKRALGGFALSAPAIRLEAGDNGARVDLVRPVTITPGNGGVLTLSAANGPVFAAAPGEAGGGALRLTATRGQGLPEGEIEVSRWTLRPDGFSARLQGRTALDFGLARGLAATLDGDLASGGGRLTFDPRACPAVTVERLELGENDVFDLAGGLCGDGRPLLTVRDGGWRVGGRLADVSASAPFLAVRVAEAGGRLDASGGPGGLELEAQVRAARVEDATTPRRFNPAVASGSARLGGEVWSGAFDLAVDGHPVGRLTLNHDGRSGAGGVTIASEPLVFAEGALQPATLSPLVEGFMQPPVTGSARFDGRVDWTVEGGTSGGLLSIPGLDFVSPAGPVRGLRGEIAFTSLTPLVTAPGQRLTADSLESVVPLTGVELGFALDKAALNVAAGELQVAGGVLSVEPFAVPLDPDQPVEGVIVLDRVQLGELIAGSGFGDKVRLDAVVSGRVPFTWRRDQGVRIAGGRLHAVQAGRLSIAREALSGLEAGGGGEGVPPNTVQDLAYQAMENLAFDLLDAEVNSLDGGRLGVLFHIRGRHDPPERQELRLSIAEFISREFLNRRLPLPSDTGIDLTLDTTLNLEQLVADVIALNRARNGDVPPEPR